jgi:hypothetical protein
MTTLGLCHSELWGGATGWKINISRSWILAMETCFSLFLMVILVSLTLESLIIIGDEVAIYVKAEFERLLLE